MSPDAPFLDFPFRIAGDGGVARTDVEAHVRDMIEQVLFTNPGERVNLPEFGCGLRNVVFAPNDDILRATLQFTITQNLNRWLADAINIEHVNISNDDETLVVEIVYALRRTLERRRLALSLERR